MELVTLNNGSAVTTSLAIADGTENEHASVILLVRKYLEDLTEFGLVDFKSESTGGRPTEYAILNEQQSTLLLTYMRNSEIVRKFKKALVKAFFDMARRIAATPALPDFQDPVAAARAWADQLEKRTLAEQQKALLEHKVAEQAPKVQFHDDVGSAINCQTFDEVAKELGTGRIRLCRWLREQGYLMENNLPYQRYIDMGLFKMIARTRKDKRSGELISYNKTLITGKGLTHIHKRINGLSVDLPANDHTAEQSA